MQCEEGDRVGVNERNRVRKQRKHFPLNFPVSFFKAGRIEDGTKAKPMTGQNSLAIYTLVFASATYKRQLRT